MSAASHFASAVILVRPAAFGWNPETAATNAFQRPLAAGLARAALHEFDRAAARLQATGVDVLLWEDTPAPVKPDAVFPNNWLSTHADGTVVLYPMVAPSRRAEVRRDLVDGLRRDFVVREVIDLCAEAGRGRFLEGTGSLVIDAAAGRAFAAASPRTDLELARAWGGRMGLEIVGFTARDRAGAAIYHTNVILSLGSGFSACGLALIDPADRPRVRAPLEARGELLDLDDAQVLAFAGNMLELAGRGGPALALSTTALAALSPAERRLLERHTALVPLEIPTIEAGGGGSARCLIAENFLPRRSARDRR